MLFDAILIILTAISGALIFLLKIIPFFIPTSWQTAITSIFAYFGYFQGWLPIYADPTATGLWASIGIMNILGYFLSALTAMFLLKGAIMVLHLFSLGKIHLKLPTFGKGRTMK